MYAEHCEALAYDIAFWMQGLDNPACPLDEVGSLTQELCEKLRALAIMVLLSKGKVDRFHHNLIRSGRTRLAFLERVRREQALDQHEFVAGVTAPLLDAIAAGDFGLAQRIAAAAPSAFRPGHEYEDDHCYAQILHRLVRGPQVYHEIPALLSKMAEVVGADDEPRLLVCKALMDADTPGFAEGFKAFLEARQREIAQDVERGELEDPPTMAVREVHVDGLAMLRLAQARGIDTELEYLFCPSLARLPMVEPYPEV